MNFISKLIIILGFTFSYNVLSQTKTLVVPNFFSKNLTTKENSFVKSLIIRIAAEQSEYRLLIKRSNSILGESHKLLKLNFSKIRKGIITGQITDSLTKQIYRKKVVNLKNRNFLLISTEYLLRNLFDIENDERREEILDKIPELEQLRQRPPRSRQKKAKSQTAIEQTKAKIDFKSRIMSIKQDLPEKLEETKKSNEKEKGKEKEKQNKSELSSQSSKQKAKSESNKQRNKNKAQGLSYDYTVFSGIQRSQHLVSDSRVLVDTVVLRNDIMQFQIGAEVAVKNVSKFAENLKLSMSYLTYLDSDTVELENVLNYSALLESNFEKVNLTTSAGLKKDSIIFGSVPEFGGGILPSKIDNILFHLSATYNYNPLQLGLTLGSSLLIVSSNSSSHFIDTSESQYQKFEIGLTKNFSVFNIDFKTGLDYTRQFYSNQKDLEIESHVFSADISYVF